MPSVRYRYDTNQPWTYVNGDRWKTNLTEGQCYNVYYAITFDAVVRKIHQECPPGSFVSYYDRTCRADWILTVVDELNGFSHKINVPGFPSTQGYRLVKPPYLTPDPGFPEQRPTYWARQTPGQPFIPNVDAPWMGYKCHAIDVANSSGQITQWRSPNLHNLIDSGAGYWRMWILEDSISNVRIRPVSPEPSNCAAKCQLTIYKNNLVIHTSTQPTCPTVELVPDGCPPGTCQVDCGSVFCCYGSDGIAVSSFNK